MPETAAIVSIQLDGIMVAMRDNQRKDTIKKVIEWKEASCATITLGTADGDLLRTVRYGHMPKPQQQHLKQHIVDDVHALCAKRPD